MDGSGQRAAVEAVWVRQLPQTRERLAYLAKAAREFSESRSMTPEVQAEVVSLAHKLAGSMGMFGYTAATEHARLVEQTADVTGMPQPERLQMHVDALMLSLADAVGDDA